LKAQQDEKNGYLFPSDLQTTHSRIYDQQAMMEDDEIIAGIVVDETCVSDHFTEFDDVGGYIKGTASGKLYWQIQ